MARIGILGGTFNPPHLGHLAIARHARDELGLDRVLFMPVHTPPHKEAEEDPGPEHRLAMCRLAVAAEPGLEVSELELRRAGPSYTVDTLRELHDQRPRDELVFLLGADMARTLPSWREPREILRLAHPAVAEREGAARAEIVRVICSLGAQPDQVSFLDMPPIAVSSSLVRERAAAGETIDDLVPAAVARYIEERRLYDAPRPAPLASSGRA